MSVIDLLEFFSSPSGRQKQYEAVRAVIVENMSYDDAADKFGYSKNSLYALVQKAKSGKVRLFPEISLGPTKRRTGDPTRDKIIEYRKKNFLSTTDIQHKLSDEGISISSRTIERILKDAGFAKLSRRTNKERGVTLKNKVIPETSIDLDFNLVQPLKIDCPAAGIFLFIPYIIESGIIDVVQKCGLPESSTIGATQACLSMLLLKLLGNERLSTMDNYDHEGGLGFFAGLNVLPKATYMTTYSCRTSENMLNTFQEELIKNFMKTYSDFYDGNYINLDFHTIPHYGDESNMEKLWCGTKNKAIKGANTVFAQDSKNNMILYTCADILRKEESAEVKRFVTYWKKVKGHNPTETLVFDCNLTKYGILDEITDDGVNFITLRKRNKKLIDEALSLDDAAWHRVTLDIPKRKYVNISINESTVMLPDCKNNFRQIIVKDHGRANPTFIITNDKKLSTKNILEVYARRWRIENKISELVSFFNLNALSSPVMIRIHFDVLWTFIADTLYHVLSRDLRRFEKHNAKTIFRKFINIPGKIIFDGSTIQVKMRKRAHTPILLGVEKFNKPCKVPWLNNAEMKIIWTA